MHFNCLLNLVEINATYCCAQVGCSRTFTNKYSFRKHILTNHGADVHVANVNADDLKDIDITVATLIMDLAMKFVCAAKSRVNTL